MGAIVLCANKLGAFCQLFYQVLFFCLSEQKPPTHFLTIRRRFETGSQQISTVQNTPICRKGHHVPGDTFSAGQKSTLSGAFQPAAAGHLHAGNGQTPNIVGHEDLRELVPVIHIIQLGTSDDRDVIVHKFLMEIAVSVGCAICRYQQVRPLIIRRTDRHQLELHRPLVQAAGCRSRLFHRLVADAPAHAARAGVHRVGMGMNRSLRRLLCPQDSVLIIGRSLPHLKGDRPGGTSRQAVTQTIAVILSGQLRLAIYHLNGPFVAGFCANSAAITSFFVDFNDFSYHIHNLLGQRPLTFCLHSSRMDGMRMLEIQQRSEKMREYLALLGQSPLFHGISPQELEGMLPCLGARELRADKHQMIFRAGDPARWVGLVLSGAVHVIQEDYYGNRSLVALLQPPQLFGEAFSCAGVDTLPVTVEAAQDSRILLLDCQRVLTTCDDACVFHRRLVTNLLKVVAAKNLMLTQKLSLLSKRTTREKLMAYLAAEAQRVGSPSFTLSLDRQALADYLGVDRSAMSAELSKLRRDGLLQCKGRHVVLQKAHSKTL